MPSRPEIDRYWLQQAVRAAHASLDPSTQNGVVLVDPRVPERGEALTQGFNSLADGVADQPDRWLSPAKYNYLIHAEAMAICNAARRGKATKGATLYGVWIACSHCADLIIQAGISRCVSLALPLPVPDRWQDSVGRGLAKLAEAGIPCEKIPGPVFGTGTRLRLLFDGQLYQP